MIVLPYQTKTTKQDKMKTVSTLFIASAFLFLASCQDAPKADKAEASDAQQAQATVATHKADVTQSKVEFIGT